MTSAAMTENLSVWRGISGAALLALLIEGGLLAGGVYLWAHHAPPPLPGKPQVVQLTFPALPTPPVAPPPPQPTPKVQTPPPVAPPPPVPVPVTPPPPPPPKPEPKPQPKPIPKPVPKPPERHPIVMHHPKPHPPVVHAEPPPPVATPAVVTPPPVSPPRPAAPVSRGVPASFEAKVRAAVQSALRYPPAAKMMHLTGKTQVGFVYRDGQISGAHIVVSSGSEVLDRAALAAVHAAQYPAPEGTAAGQTLNFRVWVVFVLHDDGDD